MSNRKSLSSKLKSLSLLLFCVIPMYASISSAQDAGGLQMELQLWLQEFSHEISHRDLPDPTDDLEALRELVGEARIVALSESFHGVKESARFRNRAFRYLIEELGFEAVALESGVVESHILNDFILGGEVELDTLFDHGITNGFEDLRQNRELILWLREYNLQLPPNGKKVQIFGFDVSGSPYYSAAANNPDVSIRKALEYLQTVDPDAAAEFAGLFQRFLPPLAAIFDYGTLSLEDRNFLTSSIADLIANLQRNKFQYIAASSESDYEWGSHAAVAARQIDGWFRHIPEDWEPADGFDWNAKSQELRDRAMLENLDWILDQLGPNGRIALFASVGHISSSQMYVGEDDAKKITTPFGMYVRDKYQDDYINILNLTVGGEVEMCNRPAADRARVAFNAPPEDSVEAMFTVDNKPQYLVDLRTAPRPVYEWLRQDHQHWNGFGSWVFSTIPAFDLAYYVSPATSDCVQ